MLLTDKPAPVWSALTGYILTDKPAPVWSALTGYMQKKDAVFGVNTACVIASYSICI